MASTAPPDPDRPRYALTMTVRNNAPTVRASLESLWPEVRDGGELAIVDAASTDATLEEIERFRQGEPRIRVLSRPCNRGQGRNLAVGLTTAPIVVTHIDADNIYVRGVVRSAVAAAESGAPGPVLNVLGRDDPNPSSTRFFVWPRAIFDRIGGYPETQLAEDVGVVLRGFRAGVRFERRMVPTVARDLQPRPPGHGSNAPPWRRGRVSLRAARKFALLGYRYPEFARYLWITRRSGARYLAGLSLGAWGYLRFWASGRSDAFLNDGHGENAAQIATVLATPGWPGRR